MKSKKYLLALLAAVVTIATVGCFVACGNEPDSSDEVVKKMEYTVSVDASKSVALEVGAVVDYKQYFTVTDKSGNLVVVTDEMLDTSKADTTKEGEFTVTLSIGNTSKAVTFTVTKKADGGNAQITVGDLDGIFAKYADFTKSNFAVKVTLTAPDAADNYEGYYQYLGANVSFTFDDEYGVKYTDYVGYDSSTDTYYYYVDNGDGDYAKFAEDTDEYADNYSYLDIVYLEELGDYKFEAAADGFAAKQPNNAGNAVLGEFEDSTWTSFTLKAANGHVSQIVATTSDGYTFKYEFSKYGSVSFTLPDGQSGDDDNGNDDNTGNGDDNTSNDLSTVLAKYADSSKWNFAATLTYTYNGNTYEEYYEHKGDDIKYVYDDDYGDQYTDYISYVSGKYYYYSEQANGSYEKYSEDDDEFDDWFWYAAFVDLTEIKDFEFTESNGVYSAKQPNNAGNSVIGQYTGITWTSFKLTVKNGNIATIAAVMSDGDSYTYALSKFGSVSFTLPNVSGGTTPVTPVTPTGTMDKQTYDEDTFDNGRLQDKITKTGDEPDPAIGLPSKGQYNALVIPVQIGNNTVSQTDLANLNIAFNGTEAQTGWQSVHSYYYNSSYGQLDISFDIAGYNIAQEVTTYKANNSASYYESHTATDPETKQKYNDGDNLILHEALSHYENKLDLTKYDYNNDGYIDGVYIIYSASVDYQNGDFYWAYVTWNYDDTLYDGKKVFYYLFAGLDFMVESVKGGHTDEYYPEIDGLKVNAATYIHETGHLLGLDDYYDYDDESGCNEGLGGADMMDATVGDQNVYSKIMLGWLTPQIVVSTQTITIKSSQERGDAILIPLNFDNSYFCEYLLIDLYSAQGLNELHANVSDSYLYDGKGYGVRIYHVTSWIDNPYNTDYGSFTDYNNTDTNTALIKLVEADGTTKFSDSDGYAANDDLWQAGKTLSGVFPNYTTNAGKKLIFDISIDSVSSSQATITITYAA